MPRIFRPNAYFEEEILEGKLFPGWLVPRNSPIESAFLVLSALKKELGQIFVHTLPEKKWFLFWKERGFQLESQILLSKRLEERIQGKEKHEVEEWGKISHWEPGVGFVIDSAFLANAKDLSSKIHQNDWKKAIGNFELPSFHIANLEDWELLVEQKSLLLQSYEKFVLKPEFGFAGTSRLCYAKDLNLVVRDHLGRWKEGFILEPWMSRTKDFSLLFSSKNGDLQLDGGTVLFSDPKGKYSGTWIGEYEEIENYLSLMDHVSKIVPSFSGNYTGFGSIDSFFFHDRTGETLRKISEINFRWTMGRMLWELKKEFSKNGSADLLIFFSSVSVPNAYERLCQWEKESGWEIYPLSPFYSSSGKPMGKNLLWIRLPKKPDSNPWNDLKLAFEWGLRYLNA